MKILSTSGDEHLGGEDFDELLLNYCIDRFKDESDIDINEINNPKQKAKALRRLRAACTKSKTMISAAKQCTIDVDVLAQDEDFSLEVTRNLFNNLCQSMFDNCIPCMENALEGSKLTKADMHDIVLVGGSTRIPRI